jgi:maltodextrin utilization protein YvdJ
VGGYLPTNIEKVINMETHDLIIAQIEQYKLENEKFTKGNKTAGIRARKALMEVMKLTKTRRAEIQEEKEWIVK